MSRLIVFVVCAGLSVVTLAGKQGKGHGKGQGKGAARVEVGVFRVEDQRIIVEYFRAVPASLPPGLAKRGDLTPGHEKQLRRNGRLPPGLEKRIVPFPMELERRLPPPPAGYQRGVIAGRAVIYSPKTSVILDVFVVP